MADLHNKSELILINQYYLFYLQQHTATTTIWQNVCRVSSEPRKTSKYHQLASKQAGNIYHIFLMHLLLFRRVNCPFYFKIGACRHGDTCTRVHNKPPLSQTMCFKHMYQNPNAAIAYADGRNVPEEDLVEAIEHFEGFYEEVFMEMAKFGEMDEMIVADNIGDHMIGNIYVKF